jgi:hypothetical protein
LRFGNVSSSSINEIHCRLLVFKIKVATAYWVNLLGNCQISSALKRMVEA